MQLPKLRLRHAPSGTIARYSIKFQISIGSSYKTRVPTYLIVGIKKTFIDSSRLCHFS
jgi:hypothetical protein